MAKDKKSCGDVIDEWQEFVWNSRTHEFLGRTASSWGMILLFYLVFYIFLGGMFTLTMYVMLQTLDDYKPTYQDRLAIPGMMIWPRGYFLEIEYSLLNPESWEQYVHSLDYFLSSYDNMQQARTNVECPPDRYFLQEDSGEVRNNPKRSCQFNRTALQACSGITDRHYGYDAGKPCILIKLNRVIGLLPSKDGQSPYITCAAKADDSAHIGELEYFPPNGTLNLMYFPYYGKKAQVNYSQPLVAIKFRNITLNTDVNVECKINADHMETSGEARDKFAGRVSFKLRINA
ncbi:sodium/potassium-transporting ATPase subunit beta-2b isoform X2 [Anguilla rostrata]|uniref:sodium/potassium-transporting ATPase subunit beta-2b isoform X2 n=1 Tax=Anguilla rostrata TaxID=7938 RepID=UPI0030D5691B